MRIFLKSGTPGGQYAERDAQALFELGQYLVLLNRANLLAHVTAQMDGRVAISAVR